MDDTSFPLELLWGDDTLPEMRRRDSLSLTRIVHGIAILWTITDVVTRDFTALAHEIRR